MSARTGTTAGTAAVAAGLRAWVRGHDRHVQAAVWLLLAQERWPARADFRAACLNRDRDGRVWINWAAARAAFDTGTFQTCSTTERALLDLVIALGENRYRLSHLDDSQARLIVAAVTHAAGGTR